MTALDERRNDPEFWRYVATEYLTPEQRAQWAPYLQEELRMAERLSLQPKQALAEQLSEEADEVLYGGAAGGGKSEWLLRHCVRQMKRYPGNRGIIFRRYFPSLAETLLPRAVALLAGWAKPNVVDHTFTFPNGSVLKLASLQYEHDVLKFQGAEYGVIAFEEITEFLEGQFHFLKTRLRAPADGVRPHMVATTNPGGPGHSWVKRRWVRPKPGDYTGGTRPGPLTIWQPVPTEVEPSPLRRVFVPALLKDNPLLIERDPDYINKIRSDPNTGRRRALEFGDWDAVEKVEGAQWSGRQLDWLRVRRAPLRSQMSIVVVGVDPSGGKGEGHDDQGIVAVGKAYNGHGYVLGDRTCSLDVYGWSRRAVAFAIELEAEEVVVEDDYGGELAVDPLERAKRELGYQGRIVPRGTKGRSKRSRAEPVAALYGSPDDDTTWPKAIMHHVGDDFEKLEDQMKTWLSTSGVSPNELDAFVHAADRVMLDIRPDVELPESQANSITGHLMRQRW